MSEKPNVLVRAWRAVRNFFGSLFGPDKADDEQAKHRSRVTPTYRPPNGGNSGGWL